MALTTSKKAAIWKVIHDYMGWSIRSAGREQGLLDMYQRLESLVPDIDGERSAYAIDTEYLRIAFRMLDAFQMRLALGAISVLDLDRPLQVLDIGDSGGRHQLYLRGLLPDRSIESTSINLDEKAVERIRAKGLNAIAGRAEDIHLHCSRVDVALCFEVIEHLTDPIRFLYSLSAEGKINHLVATVPYVRHSRVALHHLRAARLPPKKFTAENVHIFEFSPEDWLLLFKHSGWRATCQKVYLQYPRRHVARIMQPVFSRFGHEGFVGFILEPDTTFSKLYSDW